MNLLFMSLHMKDYFLYIQKRQVPRVMHHQVSHLQLVLPAPLATGLAVMLAEDDPVVACPISVTLGYLKGVLPDGVAAAWLAGHRKESCSLVHITVVVAG